MSEKQKYPNESLTQSEQLYLQLEGFLKSSAHIEGAVASSLESEYEKYALSSERHHRALLQYLTHEILVEISAEIQQKIEDRVLDYIRFLKPAILASSDDSQTELCAVYQELIREKINDFAAEITENEINNKLILLTSRIDYKTQLYNINVYENAIRRRIDSKQPTGLVFIDLDKLGPFNEALSEDVFDFLYHQFAQSLRRISRSDDLVCRTGGDEIKVILSGVEETEEVEGACKNFSESLKKQVYEIELTESQVEIIIKSWKKNSKIIPELEMPVIDGFKDTRSEVMNAIGDQTSTTNTPGEVVDPMKELKDYSVSKGLSINEIPKEEAGLIFAHNFLKSLKAVPNKRKSTEGKNIFILRTRISASLGGTIYDPTNFNPNYTTKQVIEQLNTILAQAEKEAKEERGTYVVK